MRGFVNLVENERDCDSGEIPPEGADRATWVTIKAPHSRNLLEQLVLQLMCAATGTLLKNEFRRLSITRWTQMKGEQTDKEESRLAS